MALFPIRRSLERLPVELLENITKYTTRNDTLALMKTNRLLHSVCAPALYREVGAPSALPRFACLLETLATNTFYARSVRLLAVMLRWKDPRPLFQRFELDIRNAFANLTLLHTIIGSIIWIISAALSGEPVAGPDHHGTQINHYVMQYWTDATARFLDGHPQLRTLRATRIPMGVIPAEKCSLPLLEEFGGPDTVAITVLGDAKRLTRLWITKTSMPVAELFDFIDTGRHPLDSKLIEVSFHINNWDSTLPSAIRQHTPNIMSLQIECENDQDNYIVGCEDFISSIDDALPFLPNLFHLGIAHPVCISDDEDPGVFQKLDQQLDLEFDWVQRWGDRAPSLGLCTLPSCTEWWRFSQTI
ncbi:hypothetical protein C8F01DRAFT_1083595 [Mycena amicta]|nr:hypothetical protein C8F01DRAFT_1083595 [Mycena amicta]